MKGISSILRLAAWVLLGGFFLLLLCSFVAVPLIERGLQDSIGSWKAKIAVESFLAERYPGQDFACAWPTKSIKHSAFTARVAHADEIPLLDVSYDPESGRFDQEGNLLGLHQERVTEELRYPLLTLQESGEEGPCPVMATEDFGSYDQMLENLPEGQRYAFPMLGDFDGDGCYETLHTYKSWAGTAANWDIGLLSREEFLATVKDFAHMATLANQKD